MRTAYTISAVGHAAVLLWSVWSLSATSLPVSSTEGLPVDLVTASDFCFNVSEFRANVFSERSSAYPAIIQSLRLRAILGANEIYIP